MLMKEVRLRRIQHLAHEITDEMNLGEKQRHNKELHLVIDNLSRAIGGLADPSGNYSLDYLEKKVSDAHHLIFQKKKLSSF